MPIIVHDGGRLTISPKFDHEAFVWLEHPGIDPAEIRAALGLPGGATRPGRSGEEAEATVWTCRVDPGADPDSLYAERLKASAKPAPSSADGFERPVGTRRYSAGACTLAKASCMAFTTSLSPPWCPGTQYE